MERLISWSPQQRDALAKIENWLRRGNVICSGQVISIWASVITMNSVETGFQKLLFRERGRLSASHPD
jgi:hypothetical protein